MKQKTIPMSFLAQKDESGHIRLFCASKPTKMTRLTRGENYEVFGGNVESHELMVKFVEAVSRRIKSLAKKTGGVEQLAEEAFGQIVRLSAIESFGTADVRERM
jgi:hypothetical protein